jgi:putative membrane protein
VSALREVISATSIDYTILAKDFTFLAVGLAIALVISVIFKGHADKMQAIVREKKAQ